MLGLIFIYFIGKYYYDLADKYDRARWGFAILGIASYYGGAFIFGLLVAIIGETVSTGFIDDTSDLKLGLMALPFGILTTIILYQILKRNWAKKQPVFDETVIQEIGETE